MDYGVKAVTCTRTCACGATVTVTSTVGPSNMCDACADGLRAFIFDGTPSDIAAEFIFPLAGANPVKCGNRRDLPKAQRRHTRVYLGTDARHMNDGEIADLHIYACVVCGADKQTRTPPAGLPTGRS